MVRAPSKLIVPGSSSVLTTARRRSGARRLFGARRQWRRRRPLQARLAVKGSAGAEDKRTFRVQAGTREAVVTRPATQGPVVVPPTEYRPVPARFGGRGRLVRVVGPGGTGPTAQG